METKKRDGERKMIDGKRKKVEEGGEGEAEAAVGEGKVVKSVIVCGVAHKYYGVFIRNPWKLYERYEFFRIDNIKDGIDNIKDGVDYIESIHLVPCFEPLMSAFDFSAVLNIHPHIYLMGTHFRSNDLPPDSTTIKSTSGESFFRNNGLCCVNFFQDKPCWLSCAKPPWGFLTYTALCGKIYALDPDCIQQPFVFDPNTGQWSHSHAKPPPEIEKHSISGKLIPDQVQGRIFMYLYEPKHDCGALYAWYPEDHGSGHQSWICIEPSMTYVGDMSITVADQDLLFFYSNVYPYLFYAYHVHDKQWLKLEWLAPCPPFRFRYQTPDSVSSLLYLGDRQLCLAFSTFVGDFDITKEHGCQITFLVFQYSKISKTASDSTITMRGLYTNIFYAKGIVCPVEFIPLP